MPFDSKPAPIARLQTFMLDHAAAFHCAAKLLGGPSATRRCARLLSDIGTAVAPTRRLRRELDWLHGLLTLENVHDIESEEAARFSLIDPADPRVAEICALADALRDQIEGLASKPANVAGVAAIARCV